MLTRHFALEWESEKTPATIRREMLQIWTGPLGDWGYSLTSQSDVGLTYNCTYRPDWAIFLAIILFPIGLLFLLKRDTATITATTEEGDEEMDTLVIMNGRAPKKVIRAFEEMQV